jgi:hypothetical protein
VHEVPLSERALLALDDQQRLPREHEEVLLIGLPVVHRHRLAGPQNLEVDPELGEVRLVLLEPLELTVETTTVAFPPRRFTRVEDEPTLPSRHETVLGRFQRRLRNHRRKPAAGARTPQRLSGSAGHN